VCRRNCAERTDLQLNNRNQLKREVKKPFALIFMAEKMFFKSIDFFIQIAYNIIKENLIFQEKKEGKL
jgi:hypothetical protein